LRNVLEVLDVAQDHLDDQQAEREAGIVGGEPQSSSDEDDSDTSASERGEDDENDSGKKPDGSQSYTIVDQMRDYKKDAKQKQRQHRGVMQYKVRLSCSQLQSEKEVFYKMLTFS
jgi:hypothetical protein